MYRKKLLCVTVSLLVSLASGSSDELSLEEQTKMPANNEVLSDKIAKVDGEAIILNNTETETTELYKDKGHLYESESFGKAKEKRSKARDNLLNISEENLKESTTIEPNPTEVIEEDISNAISDFETISKAPVDSVELSGFPKQDFNFVNIVNVVEEYITTDAITESDIKSIEFASESPYNANLNSDEVNYFQLTGIEDILSITTETVDTLDPKGSNSDIFSSTEKLVTTDKSDIEIATTEFSTNLPVVDTTSVQQDESTDIGIVEARELQQDSSSDVLVEDYLISQSTEYLSQNITAGSVTASTTDFISSNSSKVKTTSETSIEQFTESVPLIKTLEGNSSTILGTTEIRNSLGDTIVKKKTELENPSNKNRDYETGSYKSKINVPQTTTPRSRELNRSIIATNLRTQGLSKPKQTLLPLNWYANFIPIYPTYLFNPLNYFYNSTNQTLSGAGAPPTILNDTGLRNSTIFNFTNLLSQTLLPDVTATARHGFFRQTQSNMTKFQLFPLFKLFNATHHFNKTKFPTNTQTEPAINVSDVLNALFHHKHAKFQQRQTDQDNDGDDGTVFVRRQWYTPLVSDNLERSEGVPFLTPIVLYANNERPYYRNQGKQLLTPVITYVEQDAPYRSERPQYYREKPKLVKQPTPYREQPYYYERPYNVERPYQVEHAAYYPQPIKTNVKVQAGPISYESSPMDLSYVPPFIDVDDGDVEYYYRNKHQNATPLNSTEDTPKVATTSLVLEVELPNPIYRFMKSIYNLFMPNN